MQLVERLTTARLLFQTPNQNKKLLLNLNQIYAAKVLRIFVTQGNNEFLQMQFKVLQATFEMAVLKEHTVEVVGMHYQCHAGTDELPKSQIANHVP